MKSLRYILALGAFFVVAAGVSACGSGVPGNAVVDMAGNPVTLTAYKHWMYVAAKGNAAQSPGSPVIVPTDPPGFSGCIAQARKEIPSLAKTPAKTLKADCDQLFTSLNATVMDFLIKGYWYQAEAHRLGIKLTKAQLQAAFVTAKNQQFKTQAAFTAFLSETGQTLNDILFRVRINALFTKLEARHALSITPASIAAYYTAHTSQFGRPETRNIRIVRTKTAAAAAAAKAALLHGQSWSVVAKKYSIDTATKNNGGLLQSVTSGQEETALNNAAFAAPLNTIEGVIHGTFGYYTFEVTGITKSTQQTLAQATPLIKELIGSQNSTTEQTKVDAVAKQHWFAKTTCRTAYSMADCHGYKAPKATSTTPVAPTSTAGAPTATSGAPTSTAGAPTATVQTAPTATTPTTAP